ncbi:hypothetical protein Hanom_Chr16g01428091 [Helianthus anomalus]
MQDSIQDEVDRCMHQQSQNNSNYQPNLARMEIEYERSGLVIKRSNRTHNDTKHDSNTSRK